MRKDRKHYTAEEKVVILRQHLLDKVPVSDRCEQLSLRPTVSYRWQKEFSRTERLPFRLRSVPTARWLLRQPSFFEESGFHSFGEIDVFGLGVGHR